MELKKVVFENGVYRWRCESDEEFMQFEYRCGIRTGLAVSAIMLLLGFLLLKDEKLFIMILTCGIVVLIVLAACNYVLNRPEMEIVPYELRNDGIRIREGRGCTFVDFKRVRYMDTRENRIMLHTRFSHIPVYIPQEDFVAISDLITERVKEQSRTVLSS